MNEDELAAFLEGGAAADRPGGRSGEQPRGAAQHVRDLLADEALWLEPPPGGADALLNATRAEAPAGPRRRRSRGRPPVRWGVTLAAAAALVLVAGIAAALALGPGDGDGQEFAVTGTELAPGASAVATVESLGSGIAIELRVHDLPPAPPGTYYQGWVKGPDGLVTIGTFHLRAGDDTVELWAGVDLDRYPTLTVTLQQEGAGPESSGEVVLTGDIEP